MNIEAMKQALEALEYMHTEKCDYMRRNKLGDPLREDAARLAIPAITALRTAIEQAEKQDGDCQQCGGQGCVACDARKQEPVAYSIGRTLHWHEGRGVNDAQLYTHPPAAPVQGCDFCNHPLYAGTKCKNCGREAAAPVQDFKERLAKSIEQMPFGDTAQSFAVYVRNFK